MKTFQRILQEQSGLFAGCQGLEFNNRKKYKRYDIIEIILWTRTEVNGEAGENCI